MRCLNRKVLIGLGIVAVALFFVTPGARSVLPLLLVAACPLSMVFMMRGMTKMGSSGSSGAENAPDRQREMELKDAEIARLEAMLDNGNQIDRS